LPKEVIRSTTEEKDAQIATVASVHARNAQERPAALERLQRAALHNQNVFAELMETTKVCTLGEISDALFSVGGQYRRNM
jgi:methylmalonyl-CoA mutase